jgi:hypothetical protein
VDGGLQYGGSLVVPFDSTRLAISQRNGRLYYPLNVHEDDNVQTYQNKTTTERRKLGYGLIRSSIAVSLSENIHYGNSGGDKFRYGEIEIDWLPAVHEPGSWALPGDGEGN